MWYSELLGEAIGSFVGISWLWYCVGSSCVVPAILAGHLNSGLKVPTPAAWDADSNCWRFSDLSCSCLRRRRHQIRDATIEMAIMPHGTEIPTAMATTFDRLIDELGADVEVGVAEAEPEPTDVADAAVDDAVDAGDADAVPLAVEATTRGSA